MPRTFHYCRYSHLDSGDGYSLESQLVECRRYCQWNAARLPAIFHDPFVDRAKSAFKIPFLSREAGQALDMVLEEGDHVVFAKIDRAFRSLRDFCVVIADWQERGIIIHAADGSCDMSTPHGIAMTQMMVTFAELDSRLKSVRIKEALARAAAAGSPVNSESPYGKKWVGHKKHRRLAWDEDVRAIGQEIVRLRDTTGISFKLISDNIERRLAEHEGRTFSMSEFYKRTWGPKKCERAYAAEKAILATHAQPNQP